LRLLDAFVVVLVEDPMGSLALSCRPIPLSLDVRGTGVILALFSVSVGSSITVDFALQARRVE